MSQRLRYWLLVLFYLVAQAWPCSPCAAAGLDASYLQALGQALRQGLVFGEQLVFTYGPLGWFPLGPFDPQLAWLRYFTVDLGWGMLLACALASVTLAQGSRWQQWTCLVVFALPGGGTDGRSFVTVLVALCAVAGVPALNSALPLVVLIAALAWTKFSMLPMACIAILFGCAHLLRAGKPRRAGLVAGSFVVALLGWWLLAGQPPGAMPAFVGSALELSAAYGAAMSLSIEPVWLLLSLSGALLVLLTRERSWMSLGLVLLLAVAWKACFVRPGPNQAAYFALLAAAAVLVPVGQARWQQRAALPAVLLGLVAALCFAWSVPRWPGNARALFLPWLHLEQRAAERAALEQQFEMPGVRERVGNASVDMFSEETGLVFLNGLNWNPRPVFQSYSVWTSAMSARNAAHLVSADGPRFVLHHLTTIDERYPNHEDAASLAVLLERYEPRMIEKGYTLFERRGSVPSAPPRTLRLSGELVDGEWLELPDAQDVPMLLELESMAAPGLAALLKTAACWAEVQSSDGQTVTWRVLPGLAPAGLMVAPLLTSDDEWLRWLCAGKVPQVRRLRFSGSGGWRYRLLSVPALAAARSPGFAAQWEFAGLGLAPLEAELAPSARSLVLGKRQAVFVAGVPSRITIETGDAGVLSGRFGVWPHEPWSMPAGAVEFRIESGSQVLWSQRLDPASRPADLRLQELRLELPRPCGQLVLITAGPQTGAYWSGLRLEDR